MKKKARPTIGKRAWRRRCLAWLLVTALLLIAWGTSGAWIISAQAGRIAVACGVGVVGLEIEDTSRWAARAEPAPWFILVMSPQVRLGGAGTRVLLPGWFFVLITAAMAGRAAWRWRRTAKLPAAAAAGPVRCSSCSYDVSGVPLVADDRIICPECGRSYRAGYAEIVARTRAARPSGGASAGKRE